MKKLKTKEAKSAQEKTSVAETGSPYDMLGCGPRLKRLTTWEPERWEKPKNPLAAGLPTLSQEAMRFHRWEDRGSYSLACAFYAAKDMGRGNLSRGNFLVLAGPTGVGKTHLTMAIAWEWFEDDFSVVFSRVDDLLDDLRRGYDDNTYHQKLERIRRCSLLVLDDLGTEHAKEWAGEKMDRIVDWRYASRMPLVVTTNVKSEDLAPRLVSRLKDTQCSVVIQMDAEDYRTHGNEQGGGHEQRKIERQRQKRGARRG